MKIVKNYIKQIVILIKWMQNILKNSNKIWLVERIEDENLGNPALLKMWNYCQEYVCLFVKSAKEIPLGENHQVL